MLFTNSQCHGCNFKISNVSCLCQNPGELSRLVGKCDGIPRQPRSKKVEFSRLFPVEFLAEWRANCKLDSWWVGAVPGPCAVRWPSRCASAATRRPSSPEFACAPCVGGRRQGARGQTRTARSSLSWIKLSLGTRSSQQGKKRIFSGKLLPIYVLLRIFSEYHEKEKYVT